MKASFVLVRAGRIIASLVAAGFKALALATTTFLLLAACALQPRADVTAGGSRAARVADAARQGTSLRVIVPKPPPTPLGPTLDTLHGVIVADPYRWIENLRDSSVLAWMRTQRDYADKVLSRTPSRDAISAELDCITALGGARVGTVSRIGDGLLYDRRDKGATQWGLVFRGQLDGPDRTVLAPAQIASFGPTPRIRSYPSPDGRLVAIIITVAGRGVGTIRLLNLETGAWLPDSIPNVYDMGGRSTPWRPDSRAFVYRRLHDNSANLPADQVEVGLPIRVHEIGRSFTEDDRVFGYGVIPGIHFDPSEWVSVEFAPGSRWAVAAVHSATGSEVYVVRVDSLAGPRTAWRRAVAPEDGVARDWALHGDDLYAMSSRGTPRYRILRYRLQTPGADAEVALAEGDGVVLAVEAASDALYVVRHRDGLSQIVRVAYDGSDTAVLRMPFAGRGADGGAASPTSVGYLFALWNWSRSDRFYLANAAATPRPLDLVPPAASERVLDIESVEVEARSADGTMVPMSIVFPRGMRRDGSHPLRLEAYASHGVSVGPYYSPYYAPWYRRGGVQAECYARGGGERGEQWHLAGRAEQLGNRVADMVACAEYLIANGYTARERIAAVGTSAGGLVAGAAAVARPDLFGAAVLTAPVVDLLRSESERNGPVNAREFGSVRNAEQFRVMRAVSPVENVRPGVRYPAMLISTGINDRNVSPSQPAKLAARVQAATTSGRPVLLYVNFTAGHVQPGPPFASEIAFLLWQLGSVPAAR